MERVRIKPAKDRRVIMEDGAELPADGAPYDLDFFVHRLLRDGDVELVQDDAKAKATAKPADSKPAGAPPAPAATGSAP